MIKSFFILILPFVSCLCAQIDIKPPAFDWHPVQIGGKSYVALHEVAGFYQMNIEDNGKKTINLSHEAISISLITGKQKLLANGIKFYLSEPVRTHEQKPHISTLDLTTLLVPLIRPDIKAIPPLKTVILDAGHGGMDKGSAGLESKLTLSLAKKIQKGLEKKGIHVLLTRERDEFVSLSDRIKMANATTDAIMISLHFNAGQKNAQGMESYIMSAREARKTHAANLALVSAVHSNCLQTLNDDSAGESFQIKDRGVKRARFNVLSGSKHPTVIIEAGFLTHKQESAKIVTKSYQARLSDGIVRGILTYRSAVNR